MQKRWTAKEREEVRCEFAAALLRHSTQGVPAVMRDSLALARLAERHLYWSEVACNGTYRDTDSAGPRAAEIAEEGARRADAAEARADRIARAHGCRAVASSLWLVVEAIGGDE